jgi:hypothetical protein
MAEERIYIILDLGEIWREWHRNVSTLYWIFVRCGENDRGTYPHYIGSLRDVERMAEERIHIILNL